MDNKNKQNSNGPVKRRIGGITATGIVVANMIGAGIFTTTGIMALYLPGPVWVVGCWILGGVIAICGALSYAELATRMPEEGGEYVYLKKLYHPSLGFLTGWTSFFVGFSAPIAASALGFSAYMFAGSSQLLPEFTPFQILLLKKTMAVLIIVLLTGLHYFGVKTGSIVQNILTLLKILIIIGLVTAGVIFGAKNGNGLPALSTTPVSGFGFGTAMMLVMFSYSGWNASAYIAGEIKNPKKNLPRSLFNGTLIVILLYLAINFFILTAVPFEKIKGAVAVVETVSTFTFGSSIGNVLSILIGVTLLSSLSAFIMIGPRVYFAMALDRLFFPFASKIHPRYEVPHRSIMLQGLLAVIMVIGGTFEQLLIYVGFALGIFPLLAIFGLFIARKKKIGEGKAVPVWGFPYIPLFFLLSSFSLMVIAFINRPFESSAAIITVLLGVPVYYFWDKKVKKQDKKHVSAAQVIE